MKSQLDLFADPRPPLPPHNWSDTSRRAAHAIRNRAPSMKLRVLKHIAACGAHGATIDEIAAALEMLTQTVCGRVGELARPEDGPALIVDSGQRRDTVHGSPAKVMVATEAGVRFAQGETR